LRSLRGRLALTYFLVVLLALAAVDLLVLGALESFALHQRTVAAFTSTNIGVNLFEPFYRHGQPQPDADGDLSDAVRGYSVQTGARVLALDLSGRVVADSLWAETYLGRALTHPEVAQALAGRTASGRRWLEGTGWVLYTVAPVLQNKQPVGAVFLSSSINDVYSGLADVARTMMIMSGVALLLATVAGLGVARTITGPVVLLTRAVEKMGRGDLRQTVRVRGRDEVATLSATFNEMAARLREEDERRREFLADVAHELQTPVSAIRAMSEPLAAGGEGGRDYDIATYRELARDMEGQAERLGRLVGDLLELARLESPQVALRMEEVDLAGLLEGVVRGLSAQARAAGVTLETGVLAQVHLTADGLRLEQVFANLVTNGIKYAGPGSRVHLDLERRGAQAVVTVSDNGPGIAPEHLDHIFDRFYRVERSRSRQGGGTGLGLAIVKRIVELHGGTISARSTEGTGTTFEVRLPLKA
jgi:signal transduction histidine kinase